MRLRFANVAAHKQMFLVPQDFKRNSQTGSYLGELLDERNLDHASWQMPFRIRKIGSFEDRKNPKAGPTFHQTWSDEDVLLMVEINWVLARNSLRFAHGEVGHLAVDFYVYRPLMERQATKLQYILIKVGSALTEVSEARPVYLSVEHSGAHSLSVTPLGKVLGLFRVVLEHTFDLAPHFDGLVDGRPPLRAIAPCCLSA